MKIAGLKTKIVVTISLLVYVLVTRMMGISCIILELTGIKCLGCGMTRALIAALNLDFQTAFSYHFMFWTVPVLYMCFLFDGKLFPKRWQNILLYSIIFVGFLINYIK